MQYRDIATSNGPFKPETIYTTLRIYNKKV